MLRRIGFMAGLAGAAAATGALVQALGSAEAHWAPRGVVGVPASA